MGGGVKNASVSAITPATQSLSTAAGAAVVMHFAGRQPVEPPVEGANDAIGRGSGEPPFPRVEENLKHPVPCYTQRIGPA